MVSILSRDRWQAGAAAANEAGPFGYSEARLERPGANFSGGRGGCCERIRTLAFQGPGYYGFEDAARSAQRQVVIFLLKRLAAIGIGLLKHRAKIGVANELEAARSRRLRCCGCRRKFRSVGAILHSGKRGDGLLQNVDQSIDDLGGRRAFRGATLGGTHQKCATEGTRQPM